MGFRSLLACVRAHKDLPAFCQFFALLPNFVISRPLFAYWACGKSAESALHVIFPQCTACSIPSVHCTQAHKHSSLGCLQTNISSSPSLAPVSVSCCGQASSPWDGTTFYTKYCTSTQFMTFAPTCIKELSIIPSGEGFPVLRSSKSLKLPYLAQLTQNWPECPPCPIPAGVSLAAPCHDVVIPQLKYKPGAENGKNNIITLTRPGDLPLHSTATQQRASEQ